VSAAIAGAIFDLDGTLADTLPICFVTFRRALERLGGPSYSDAEIRARLGPSEDGMFQRAVPARWREAFEVYLEEYERHLPLCGGVFPGVAASLRTLRERGLPAALVTGKASPTATMSLEAFGLDGAFDTVETGSPLGIVKAAALGRIVASWRVPPREVIYVGDAVADIEAAHEAGVLAVAAAWAPSAVASELHAMKPHVLFTDAGDFHAWLVSRVAP
jgi:phosphoglycolate phosphatase-like HAD superfamily hydrolase